MKSISLALFLIVGCASIPEEKIEPCPDFLELQPNAIQKCECNLNHEPMCYCWEEPFFY